MYILATFPANADFERRVVRALGHRGHVVAVVPGSDKSKCLAHNKDKQVARGSRYVLWWEVPGSDEPEPLDSARLLLGIATDP